MVGIVSTTQFFSSKSTQRCMVIFLAGMGSPISRGRSHSSEWCHRSPPCWPGSWPEGSWCWQKSRVCSCSRKPSPPSPSRTSCQSLVARCSGRWCRWTRLSTRCRTWQTWDWVWWPGNGRASRGRGWCPARLSSSRLAVLLAFGANADNSSWNVKC